VYRFSATHTLSDFPLLIGEILRRGKFVLGAVPSGACFLRESKGPSEIAISTVLLATAAICEARGICCRNIVYVVVFQRMSVPLKPVRDDDSTFCQLDRLNLALKESDVLPFGRSRTQ
jgi:hypothetical protein